MKQIAFLEYAFMFDPTETFANVYDFENQLADFMKSRGYEARVLDTVRGQLGRGVFLISKAKPDLIDKAEIKQDLVEKKVTL